MHAWIDRNGRLLVLCGVLVGLLLGGALGLVTDRGTHLAVARPEPAHAAAPAATPTTVLGTAPPSPAVPSGAGASAGGRPHAAGRPDGAKHKQE